MRTGRGGRAATIAAALAVWLVTPGCGGSETKPAAAPQVPVQSTTVEAPEATAPVRVLILGTSLAAGLGLDPDSSYPAVLQRLADSASLRVEIVNGGLSGETSAGALRRVEWLLRERADVVVIETGANDGLRGLDPDSSRANLVAIIERIRAHNPQVRVLLAQMEAPPNLGPRYTREFHDNFLIVARDHEVTLIPFFLEGVAGVSTLNQSDGIHPNEEGARRAALNLWRTLSPVLRQVPGAVAR